MAERTPEQQAALIAWAEVTLGQLGINPDCDPEELELFTRALRGMPLIDTQVQSLQQVFARCCAVKKTADAVRKVGGPGAPMKLLWCFGHERLTAEPFDETLYAVVTLRGGQKLSFIQGVSLAIGNELPFEEVAAYVDRVPSVLARRLNTDDPAERTSPIVIPFAGGSFIFEKEGDDPDMRPQVWLIGGANRNLPSFTRIVRSM